mmetsp:Transcript_73290/g.116008  ORF Transcript_73290/g.116008 Transcript_73290/m.116008 type:complete len:217 (+) Transcript_73290:51-701(+)
MGIYGKPQWSTATARAAAILDLNPHKDEQLMWIAEHAAVVELPHPWQDFEDAQGEKAYYHPKTKFLTKEHPIMSKYKKFVQKVRKFQERNNTVDKKVVPHLAVILNEVLNRVYKDLPPVTPDIIERLAILLYIDTEVEFFSDQAYEAHTGGLRRRPVRCSNSGSYEGRSEWFLRRDSRGSDPRGGIDEARGCHYVHRDRTPASPRKMRTVQGLLLV